MPRKGGRYYDDRRSHRSKKDSRKKGDSSTESDDDVEGKQQAKTVGAIERMRSKMRKELAEAKLDDNREVVDLTREGPAPSNRQRLTALDSAKRVAEAEYIDGGDAFRPAEFRSSRGDRAKKAVDIQRDTALFTPTVQDTSAPADAEGPLLPGQQSVADIVTAPSSAEATLKSKYGDAAIYMPDYLFDAPDVKRARWQKQWQQIRGEITETRNA